MTSATLRSFSDYVCLSVPKTAKKPRLHALILNHLKTYAEQVGSSGHETMYERDRNKLESNMVHTERRLLN